MLESSVRDVMSTDLVGVGRDMVASKALSLMVEKRISCVFVVEQDKPVGIITERGFLRRAAKGTALDAVTVGDIMDSPVKSVRAKRKLIEVCGLLDRHHVRHLGVVNKAGKLCGVLTQTNVVEALGFDYFVSNARVESIMSSGVVALGGGCMASDALNAIAGKGISCVVIMDGAKPGGIITERDMCRMLNVGLESDEVACSDIMSSPVVSLRPADTIAEAVMSMQSASIRHIVVVGEDGLAGIVTQSDLVRGHELLQDSVNLELVVK